MFIKTITMQNFRNHASTTLNLAPGINILTGNNAQGKTNILEAVYLTCVGRTWRTTKDREMIAFNKRFARVKTTVAKSFGDCTVEVVLENSETSKTKKYIRVNQTPVSKMGELMGTLNCVFFSPDELRLIKEAPADRRRFLDIDISQIDKNYFYALLRYNKILAQRNALLKQLFSDMPSLKASGGTSVKSSYFTTLDTWDTQLAEAGTQITNRRIAFVNTLKQNATAIHNTLTNTKEHIDTVYMTSYSENDLATALCAAREKDIRLRTTSVGPHRDDLQILINGKDTRTLASQGQQRTAALALKLAEIEIFRQATNETPLLLLDDVLSELDSVRQASLLGILTNCQSIVTTTTLPRQANVKVFTVDNGTVRF